MKPKKIKEENFNCENYSEITKNPQCRRYKVDTQFINFLFYFYIQPKKKTFSMKN